MDNLAIARVLAEIGDLLEIKNENPFKIRAYRNASETIAHHPDRVADHSPLPNDWRCPASARISRPRSASSSKLGTIAVPPGSSSGVSADHPRSAAPPGRGPEDRGAALSPTRHPDARRSRGGRRAKDACDGSRGWARRKRRFILRALEERPGRRTPADRRSARHRGRARGTLVARAPAAAIAMSAACAVAAKPAATSTSCRRRASVDHGCIHRLPARRARAGARRNQVERPALGRLSGRSAARPSRERWRRPAVFHRLQGSQHRPARPGHPARLEAERVRLVSR